MAILSNAKAEPTDPIRGVINDVIDIVGFPRPEDALGTPADVVHLAGLPTVRDALPQPIDVWSRMSRTLRRGMPAFPRPPALPAPDSLFPMPGEAQRETAVGEDMATASTGASPLPYRQRYY